VVFGIPGVHTLDIYDALYDQPQIRHIVARHEQGAAFMADGYARASGKVGVALVITGPGVTNASTAVGGAYADGSPLLLISSEVDSRQRGKGNLHELKDQLGMMQAITLWNARAESVAQIPSCVHEALQRIAAGWPGPVHVEISTDVLASEEEVEFRPRLAPEERAADPAEVSRAAALLRGAQHPLIFAGWGVTALGANAELTALAERLQAPVLSSPIGKGAIPEDHPLALGSAWREGERMTHLVQGADVVLAVGTRLGPMEVRGAMPWPHLIHIDPQLDTIGRCYPAEVGLVGHPRAVLSQLLERVGPAARPRLAEEVAAAREEIAAAFESRAPEAWRLLADIRSAIDRESIVCLDMTLPAYWASAYFPVYGPRTFLDPYNFMALGFGLPAAIGAKIACPERPVVALCGDGGLLFTVQELATAAHYGLDLTIVLFNNDGYGAIRRHQQRRYDGRVIDADLTNPDFVRLAEAFGAQARRLASPSEVGPALRQAQSARGLWLIEVPIHDLPAPW
jgi:thiamine pyrophosphate-dependent acetolactate synthase large subunit-like protein